MTHSFKLDLLRASVPVDDLPEIPDNALTGPPAISRASLISCVNDVRVNFATREEIHVSGKAPLLEWDGPLHTLVSYGGSCEVSVKGGTPPYQWYVGHNPRLWVDAEYTDVNKTTGVPTLTVYRDMESGFMFHPVEVTDDEGKFVVGYVTLDEAYWGLS